VIRLVSLVLLLMLVGCTTSPPSNVGDLCDIFEEKDGWYDDAADAQDEWGSTIPVMMAIMYQESRFKATAKPPRKKILWVIPGPRPSSSYGYTQALESTWATYIRDSGNYGADRDDFGDSVDFVGWYNDQSHRRSGIRKDDAYHLYLAYHEGHGGFNRRTYKKKKWLKDVSKKVSRQSARYTQQLKGCEKDLKGDGWFFGFF
jgi:hypothetical protein